MRGLRPWDQFLDWCDMYQNTDGSWLQAAVAADDRHLPQWELLYETISRDRREHRPGMVGFDGLRSDLYDLMNLLRQMLKLPVLPKPEGPMDRVRDRKKQISTRRLDAALGYD